LFSLLAYARPGEGPGEAGASPEFVVRDHNGVHTAMLAEARATFGLTSAVASAQVTPHGYDSAD
jgi:hypothetical protein